MRKSSLYILAASTAFIPSVASAQAAPPAGYAPQMAPAMPPPNVPRHLDRGWMVNPFWFGPQFNIANWSAYGFTDPGADRRWIRYYDDAYMIDRTGQIVEVRNGFDWDQFADQWDVVNGIPAYRGSRAWQPGSSDYAYYSAAGYQTPPGYPTGPAIPATPPVPNAAYGYAQYYGGYGYGYWGPPVIIYQIGGAAAAAGAAQAEEVIEEYYQAANTTQRRRATRHRAPRRPPPGERG